MNSSEVIKKVKIIINNSTQSLEKINILSVRVGGSSSYSRKTNKPGDLDLFITTNAFDNDGIIKALTKFSSVLGSSFVTRGPEFGLQWGWYLTCFYEDLGSIDIMCSTNGHRSYMADKSPEYLYISDKYHKDSISIEMDDSLKRKLSTQFASKAWFSILKSKIQIERGCFFHFNFFIRQALYLLISIIRCSRDIHPSGINYDFPMKYIERDLPNEARICILIENELNNFNINSCQNALAMIFDLFKDVLIESQMKRLIINSEFNDLELKILKERLLLFTNTI